jgi:hypothetical protein
MLHASFTTARWRRVVEVREAEVGCCTSRLVLRLKLIAVFLILLLFACTSAVWYNMMLQYKFTALFACALFFPVQCQDTTTTVPPTTAVATSSTSESSSTAEGAAPPTTSIGATSTSPENAFVTSLDISVDDLWRLFVGPVQVYSVNTTVSPTPVPSSELIPPPPLNYPSFPTGAQNPMMSTNSSWSFPSNFFWGVASAAFQVEGAVKDEGRGPCIWDVFLHRVTGFSTANETGDIANNQYYYYKQGRFISAD